MLSFHVRLIYLFGGFATLVSAINVRGWITLDENTDHKILNSVRVVLDNGKWSSAVTRVGGFEIPHVPPGTYVLSVLAPQHQFDTLRVDVLADSNIPEIRPYIPGTPLEPPAAVKLPYPIELQPRRHVSFFVPIESFNLMGMFQNPMMLLMGVTAIIAIGAPYLLKSLDPDTLKEITDQHKTMAQMQSKMDLSSGLSNLLNNATAPKPNSSVSDSETKQGGTPSKGKYRAKRR